MKWQKILYKDLMNFSIRLRTRLMDYSTGLLPFHPTFFVKNSSRNSNNSPRNCWQRQHKNVELAFVTLISVSLFNKNWVKLWKQNLPLLLKRAATTAFDVCALIFIVWACGTFIVYVGGFTFKNDSCEHTWGTDFTATCFSTEAEMPEMPSSPSIICPLRMMYPWRFSLQ